MADARASTPIHRATEPLVETIERGQQVACPHDRSTLEVAREWTMAKARFAVIFGERFIKAMAA